LSLYLQRLHTVRTQIGRLGRVCHNTAMTTQTSPLARWIDVTPEGWTALAEWGWPVPNEDGGALLGLPPTVGPVPGAAFRQLRSAPGVVWWAGDSAALRRWCRREGLRPVRRWPTTWHVVGRAMTMGERVQIIGVLNVTPDSFSDGGRYVTVEEQVDRIAALRRAGADWIDIGGESTRPGHDPVADDEEWNRLAPVLTALSAGVRRQVSVDTRHAAVARRAVALGVAVINDVSGGPDPAMHELLRASDCGYVYMYNRPVSFREDQFDLGTVLAEIDEALARLTDLPGGLRRVMVDPGLGFAYGYRGNLTVLRNLGLFRLWDRPVLVGGSRKRFLGRLTGKPVDDRDAATAALSALVAWRGADAVRVHDVGMTRDAVAVAEGLRSDE
jgi:dihydropteroate synthase